MSTPQLPMKRPSIPIPKGPATAGKLPVPPGAPTLGVPGAAPGATPTTATGRARQALEKATNSRSAPPETKKEAVTGAAKDILKGAAEGAVKGAAGGAAGAGAGALKGAAVSVLKNPFVRSVIAIGVAIVIVFAVVVPIISVATASYAVILISTSTDAQSSTSAESSGSSSEDINMAQGMVSSSTVPWTVLLAVTKNTGTTANGDALSKALDAADRDGLLRDLASGAVYDQEKLVRRIGDTDEQKAQAAAVKAVYLTALGTYGLSGPAAESVYAAALKWTLGDAVECAVPSSPTGTGGTTGGAALTGEQQANAITIIGVARYLFPAIDQRRAAVIGLATARQESGLRSINYGDLAGPDSRGLFQQRTSWGPLAVRMDPAGAAGLFFQRLNTVAGWQGMKLSVAAKKVQVFADGLEPKYDANEAWATAFVDANLTATAPLAPPAGIGITTPVVAGPTTVTPAGCVTPIVGAWVSPLDLTNPTVKFSDFFGPRHHVGTLPFHYAVDLEAPANTPILAAHAGIVTAAALNGNMGNSITIREPDGSYTMYNHIIDGGYLVAAGDAVVAGQQIAKVGMTGEAAGTHLDFRTFTAEPNNMNAQDPIAFLLERGVDLRVIPIDYASLETVPTF